LFERFNEEYATSNGTYQQKAWQNFLTAWDMTTGIYSFDTTPKANKQFLNFVGEMQYDQVNSALMAGFTDGSASNLGFFRDNWDRKKFKTTFEKTEWKSALRETSRNEIEKFFDIEETSHDVILTFKRDMTESCG
jgi:hypothetical protein